MLFEDILHGHACRVEKLCPAVNSPAQKRFKQKTGDPLPDRPRDTVGGINLFGRFRGQVRRFPAVNAGGHVFDVGVTKRCRRLGRFQIRAAFGVAAIGHDERALVRRQTGGEVILDGREAQRARHMTGGVGIGTVRVNDDGGLGVRERLNVGGANVGEFAGKGGGGKHGGREEGEIFFHVVGYFGWLMVG